MGARLDARQGNGVSVGNSVGNSGRNWTTRRGRRRRMETVLMEQERLREEVRGLWM